MAETHSHRSAYKCLSSVHRINCVVQSYCALRAKFPHCVPVTLRLSKKTLFRQTIKISHFKTVTDSHFTCLTPLLKFRKHSYSGITVRYEGISLQPVMDRRNSYTDQKWFQCSYGQVCGELLRGNRCSVYCTELYLMLCL